MPVARPVAGVLRVAGAVLVLALLVGRLGGAPFRAGLAAISVPAVLAAFALTAVATVAASWRWLAVASVLAARPGHRAGLSVPVAIGAYYRSQLLNSILPGGVLGDGHRAVATERRVGGVVRSVRVIAHERIAGQVVQVAVTAAVLLLVPSPVRPVLRYVLVAIVAVALIFALAFVGLRIVVRVAGPVRAGRIDSAPGRGPRGDRPGRLAGAAHLIRDQLYDAGLVRTVWPQLVISSVVVVAAHLTTLLIAARVIGVPARLGELVVLLLLIQLAAAVPFNVGGWGPREGVAAWVFGAAGLGADTGVSVTTLYAVMALVALTPGAILVLSDAVRRRSGDG